MTTAIRERPILFSGPMVQAILNGRKSATRRVMKPQLEEKLRVGAANMVHGWPHRVVADNTARGCGHLVRAMKCPYGKPGDRLYVRETWADVNTEAGPAIMYRADGAVQTWHDFSETFGPDYGAGPSMDYEAYPGDYTMWWSDLHRGEPGHRWKPSIHMPRWASRILLEVTEVRVERLQDISDEDAEAEGVDAWIDLHESPWCLRRGPSYDSGGVCVEPESCDCSGYSYREHFQAGWDSLNAKRGYSWESNPWVWVVGFKRLEL